VYRTGFFSAIFSDIPGLQKKLNFKFSDLSQQVSVFGIKKHGQQTYKITAFLA